MGTPARALPRAMINQNFQAEEPPRLQRRGSLQLAQSANLGKGIFGCYEGLSLIKVIFLMSIMASATFTFLPIIETFYNVGTDTGKANCARCFSLALQPAHDTKL